MRVEDRNGRSAGRRDEEVISQPKVYVVASEALKRFVSRRKLTRIPLDALSRDLSAPDAWRLIIAEQAA